MFLSKPAETSESWGSGAGARALQASGPQSPCRARTRSHGTWPPHPVPPHGKLCQPTEPQVATARDLCKPGAEGAGKPNHSSHFPPVWRVPGLSDVLPGSGWSQPFPPACGDRAGQRQAFLPGAPNCLISASAAVLPALLPA